VVLEMSVAANTTLATLRDVSRMGMMDFRQEASVADGLARQLGVKMSALDAPVASLSGGNQQKVALARWLAAKPRVLILDEPTQGVDVGAKAEIHRLMCELAGRGTALVMISSELPEVLGMSDRVAVMHAGRVIGVVERASATQELVMEMALGHTSAAGSMVPS
jgi:rhamnose transport system ATP-binding protein